MCKHSVVALLLMTTWFCPFSPVSGALPPSLPPSLSTSLISLLHQSVVTRCIAHIYSTIDGVCDHFPWWLSEANLLSWVKCWDGRHLYGEMFVCVCVCVCVCVYTCFTLLNSWSGVRLIHSPTCKCTCTSLLPPACTFTADGWRCVGVENRRWLSLMLWCPIHTLPDQIWKVIIIIVHLVWCVSQKVGHVKVYFCICVHVSEHVLHTSPTVSLPWVHLIVWGAVITLGWTDGTMWYLWVRGVGIVRRI